MFSLSVIFPHHILCFYLQLLFPNTTIEKMNKTK